MPSSTELSSTRHTLQNPRTQDVFQSIVKGRKSWKTLKGGEVVWPPELEAALIEGLENYQPDDSRETRLLGRFPMRNRFISDWIFEKTGTRRTAKQVGSRLQQLRDTCGGKRLLNLLSPNRRHCRALSLSPEFQHRDGHLIYGPPSLRYESESCSDSSASSPTTPTEAHATLQNLLYRGVETRIEESPDTIVYIDLLSHDSPMNNNGRPDDHLKPSLLSPSAQAAEEHSLIQRGYKVVRASQHPRHLSEIDPTITLTSRMPTSARSYFTVRTDEGTVFSESTMLEPLEPALASSSQNILFYRTPFVPGFWENISNSSNASRYTIIQRVVQDNSSSPSSTIFSAIYRFNYVSISPQAQTGSPPYLPPATVLDQPMPKSEFALESMLSMDTESFTDMMGFPKQNTNYFDINSYMRSGDWSGSSSSGSVYPSPVDCSRPMPMPCIINDEHMLPNQAYPVSEIPNYS